MTPLSILNSINEHPDVRVVASSRKRLLGFTLVELIVVITILAILGTIGFLAIGSYSSKARDSERTSDMVNLAKGMEVLLARGVTLPQPDMNMITLTASGTPIGYQGYAGANTLRTTGLGGKFQDPLSNNFYTYSTNISQNKYQILGLLENGDNLSLTLNELPGIPTTYAWVYDSRYPITKGASLGILLGTGASLNQPVQELYQASSFTGVDLVKTTTGSGYTLFFAKNDSSAQTPTTGSWAYTGSLFTFVYNKREDLLKDKTLAVNDSSLVGYWDMETLTGALLKDLSGYGNHGTCYNSASPVTCGWWSGGPQLVSGNDKSGKAMMFDGTDDYIDMGNRSSLNMWLKDFTIVVMAKTNNYTPAGWDNSFVSKLYVADPSPRLGYQFTVRWVIDTPNTWKLTWYLGWGCVTTGTCDHKFTPSVKKITDSTWHHLATTIARRANQKIFIDGIVERETNIASTALQNEDNNSNFYIGRFVGGLPINGTISEVRIYNRALSDLEIQALYVAEK